MKRIVLFITLILPVLFTSCEKVINVNLNDSEKKYVVEGSITNRPGTCTVLLSQTKNFSDNNDFSGVSGAVVSITDDAGHTTELTETTAGVYTNPQLAGMPGAAYTLKISVQGHMFTSVSVMPAPVKLDSIFVTEDNTFTTKKLVNVVYRDPKGKTNYYRFVQYVKGLKEKTIYVRDDLYTDGNLSSIKLRYLHDKDDNIKTGDSIMVDMLCIDKPVFDYWNSLNKSATGNSQSATPANPITNITGGAIGYFSAHTIDTRKIVSW